MATGDEVPEEPAPPEEEEPPEDDGDPHAGLRRRLREVNALSRLNQRLNGERSW
ncbi:hypothetical protein [Streptomyces profundus]|uniref:hypothetical protein n=1 Tax=Streptomyces profundus TaxID=2867410 RepID=UPI001D16777A|nr:hypothetical protein [Streptomyces sp. MA3_2.13]UED86566.1 hypothetical protein K4G22_22205 [Streptomyces sp. MA3_2.13]